MKKSLQKIYFYLKYKLYDEDYCLFGFFCLILVLLICCGCKSPKNLTDTTVVHIKDSTVINYKDSLITVEIPVERIVDVVPVYDTLRLSTKIAQAEAYVDTLTHTLKGSIENKPDGTLTKTVYLPSKERIVYRDSIRDREIPVEVKVVKYKVPNITKWLIVILLGLVGFAYRKYIARFFKALLALI